MTHTSTMSMVDDMPTRSILALVDDTMLQQQHGKQKKHERVSARDDSARPALRRNTSTHNNNRNHIRCFSITLTRTNAIHGTHI